MTRQVVVPRPRLGPEEMEMLRTARLSGESLSAALRRLVRKACSEPADASLGVPSALARAIGAIQRDVAEIKGVVTDLADGLGRIERLGTVAPPPSGGPGRPEDVEMKWALKMADDLGKEG